MSQPQVYVVMGQTGEYSDKREWAVMAYLSRELADKHADDAMLAAARVNKIGKGAFYGGKRDGNPYDPHMCMDYTGTDYYVLVVPMQGSEVAQ